MLAKETRRIGVIAKKKREESELYGEETRLTGVYLEETRRIGVIL